VYDFAADECGFAGVVAFWDGCGGHGVVDDERDLE
jgi:hypothetical protein